MEGSNNGGGIAPEVWNRIMAAKIASGPGANQNRAYGDAPVQQLLSAFQNRGVTGNGTDPAMARAAGFDIVPYLNGTFAINRAGVPGMGASQHNDTAYDIIDAQGNYLGSNTWRDMGTDKVDGVVDAGVKIATAAMIGGGFLGAAGIGPMASGGAGATGAGGAGYGIVGGATEPAASLALGGGAASGAGAVGGGVAGVGGIGGAAGAGGGSSFLGAIGSALGGGGGGTGWASLIAPAMSAVGGWMQSNAAEDAAAAQMGAAREGIGENRRQFDKVMELLNPYIQAGGRGLDTYEALAGSKGPQAQAAAIAQLQQGSEYGSLVSEGENAILQNASATGGLRGGNTQASLAQFRPKLLASLIDRQLGRFDRLTQFGQNSAAGAGTAALQTGTNNANLMQQAGAAQAGGIVAGSNAITNAMGNVGGFFAGYGVPGGGVTPPNPYAGRAF